MTLPHDVDALPVRHRLHGSYSRKSALKAIRAILFRDRHVVHVRAFEHAGRCHVELEVAGSFRNLVGWKRFAFIPARSWRAAVQQAINVRDRLPI